MCVKIPSKIRWNLEFALALVVAWLFAAGLPRLNAAEGDIIRVYFDFEAQSFALRVADGQAEALSCHGGSVLRRGVGAISAPFQRALSALEHSVPGGRPPLAISREQLVEPGFFVIVHFRFTLSGGSRRADPVVRDFLEAARTLALELPVAELGGLYLQAFPSGGAAPGEPLLAEEQTEKLPALVAALAEAPFPLRVSDPERRAGLPRESLFSVRAPGGQWYLVSYAQGAPFSLADWFSR